MQNFVGRCELVHAEIAGFEGRALDVLETYTRAVPLARRHGFTQVEALAASFVAARGDEATAQAPPPRAVFSNSTCKRCCAFRMCLQATSSRRGSSERCCARRWKALAPSRGGLGLLRCGVWYVPARAQLVDGAIAVTQEALPLQSDVLPPWKSRRRRRRPRL